MLSLKNSLKVLRKTNALIEGHFVLSSGLHSPMYIQCARLLSYPHLSKSICNSLAKKIKNRFKKIDLIKINIEGHEYKILPEIIKNKDKINKVVCQLHGDYVNHLNDVHNDLLNDLKELDLLQKWFYEW